MDNKVEITNSDTNFNVNISLNNLTWDNLIRLEFIIREYVKLEEEGLKNWSEEEKEEWHVYKRMHPAIETRDLIRESILKINPAVEFDSVLKIKRMSKKEWNEYVAK